jgi:hypothetical protein
MPFRWAVIRRLNPTRPRQFSKVLNPTEDAYLKNVSTFDVDEHLRD